MCFSKPEPLRNGPNTRETSKWCEDVFTLPLLKEIKFEKGHNRIIGDSQLTVEIMDFHDSKTLADAGLASEDAHRLRGYFKIISYLSKVAEAEKYFKATGVKFEHQTFEDDDIHS